MEPAKLSGHTWEAALVEAWGRTWGWDSETVLEEATAGRSAMVMEEATVVWWVVAWAMASAVRWVKP